MEVDNAKQAAGLSAFERGGPAYGLALEAKCRQRTCIGYSKVLQVRCCTWVLQYSTIMRIRCQVGWWGGISWYQGNEGFVSQHGNGDAVRPSWQRQDDVASFAAL